MGVSLKVCSWLNLEYEILALPRFLVFTKIGQISSKLNLEKLQCWYNHCSKKWPYLKKIQIISYYL